MRVIICNTGLNSLNGTDIKKIKELSNGGFNFDVVDDVKDMGYYLDIRHYDFIIYFYDCNHDILELFDELNDSFTVNGLLVDIVDLDEEIDIDTEIKLLEKGLYEIITKKEKLIEKIIAKINVSQRLIISKENKIEINGLYVDLDEEIVTYKDTQISLRGKPFEVLCHLMRHNKQICSKEQLLDAIWEEPELVTPNVVEVCISQIRQKIDKPCNIKTIDTIRRRGFRFSLD